MHGRIVNVEVAPDDLQEAIEIYRDSVMPAAQEQKGFRGSLLFTDSNTGKAVSITIWDSEEDLMRGQSSGYYQEQIAKFASFLTRTPDQEGYQLSLNVLVEI